MCFFHKRYWRSASGRLRWAFQRLSSAHSLTCPARQVRNQQRYLQHANAPKQLVSATFGRMRRHGDVSLGDCAQKTRWRCRRQSTQLRRLLPISGSLRPEHSRSGNAGCPDACARCWRGSRLGRPAVTPRGGRNRQWCRTDRMPGDNAAPFTSWGHRTRSSQFLRLIALTICCADVACWSGRSNTAASLPERWAGPSRQSC